MWDDAQSDKTDRRLHWQISIRRHTDIPKPQNMPHIQVSTHRERHWVQQSVRTSTEHVKTKKTHEAPTAHQNLTPIAEKTTQPQHRTAVI